VIRPATHDDLDAIVAMSAKFYATTTYARWAPMCPDTVRDLAAMLIDTGVMLVAEAEGAVVGMVGLCVAPFMFNRAKRGAYEVVWWVEPTAQGAGIGRALLAAVEPACRAAGCDIAQMVHLSTSPPQAAALYEREGYRHTESSYTLTIKEA
jgi:GNAT superfamily N-acetyltransferase